MRKQNFNREADFCRLVRQWYEAEDEPGLSATERVRRRLRVKEYLLNGVNCGRFPPYGMYVKGFPKVWFEGMLQRIDTTVQLYSVVTTGCYNQRSISSLVNETFFGELSELEPTKLGCPKAISIPRLMSSVTELMHYRCDPSDRMFHMNTTRRSVYPKEPILPMSSVDMSGQSSVTTSPMDSTHPSSPEVTSISLSDHSFDKFSRRKKKRQSKRTDISKPQAVSRGCLPIRHHHKCDESKILPTTRLGIDLKDSIEKI